MPSRAFAGCTLQALAYLQELTLQLDAFPGADHALVRGIAFTAGQPAGEFRFLIGQVEIR